jgi:small-conductance mechanosensitive channel
MGQPNEVNEQEEPGMWVRARQFTGRIVTVTNDKIFAEPVYNFTREFPYIWEEIHVPVRYDADRDRAERILIDAVVDATRDIQPAAETARVRLQKRYGVALDTHEPRVFCDLTEKWLEMSVRFIVPDHGIRQIKDRINRTIVREFGAAVLAIASASIGGLPGPGRAPANQEAPLGIQTT